MLHQTIEETAVAVVEAPSEPPKIVGDGWEMWEVGGVKTVQFADCWVHVDAPGLHLHTSFRDGTSLWSVPMYEKDIHTARLYGYGDDILSLWREHDIVHHRVAACFGLGYSPTLWSECHEDHPDALPRWAKINEEIFVGHVHRWLNRGEWHVDLGAFAARGHDTDALLADFQLMLRELRGS